MNKLSDDLYKKVVSPGTGEVCPKNSRVTIEYNAFWEKKKEAFDSTYLRGQANVSDNINRIFTEYNLL
jgi:FKBP-type peptidyl-prolyl cis-trans isomerase